MKTDQLLIDQANGYIRKRGWKPEHEDRINIERLIELYDVHALLSRGPNPNRAADHEAKAAKAKRRLANAIEQGEACGA